MSKVKKYHVASSYKFSDGEICSITQTMSNCSIGNKKFRMTLEIIYSDGRIESSSDDYQKIKSRFANLVHSAVSIYLDGVREIRLLDSANRVFKSYIQHF